MIVAVSGNNTTLSNSLYYITKIQEAWDETWESTFFSGFANGGSPYFMLVYISAIIATLCSIYWIHLWAKDINNGNYWARHLPHMAMVLVVAYFLAGNGTNLASLIYGSHLLGRSWEVGILQYQINGVKIAEVLNDQLLTSQAKDSLERAYQACDALPAPAVAIPSPTPPQDTSTLNVAQQQVYTKLKCYENLVKQATNLEQEYTKRFCWGGCAGLARFFSNLKSATTQWLDNLKAQATGQNPLDFTSITLSPVANVMLTSTLNQLLKWVLYAIQKIFTHLMEFGQWAAGLSAPIYLAIAVVPFRQNNSIASWLIIYFNIWLIKIYYILILGVYASIIATAQTQTLEDLSFAFVLGLFAPLIAGGLATGGALVMIRSVASAGGQVAGAVVGSVASVMLGSLRMFRFLAKR